MNSVQYENARGLCLSCDHEGTMTYRFMVRENPLVIETAMICPKCQQKHLVGTPPAPDPPVVLS